MECFADLVDLVVRWTEEEGFEPHKGFSTWHNYARWQFVDLNNGLQILITDTMNLYVTSIMVDTPYGEFDVHDPKCFNKIKTCIKSVPQDPALIYITMLRIEREKEAANEL